MVIIRVFLSVAILFVVSVGLAGGPSARAEQSAQAGRVLPPSGLIRMAYYYPPDSRSFESLQANAHRLDVVAPHWLEIDESGEVRTGEVRDAAAVLRGSTAVVLPSVVLTSRLAGSRIVNDPAVGRTAITQLLSAVAPWDGLALDFEGLDPGDRGGLSAFIQTLGAALRGAGKYFVVAVPAKTSDVQTGWAGAYDFPAIAGAADLYLVMAYGFRTSSSEIPGSTAPLSWVDASMAYAVSQLPADRLLLGVPFYGYDWNLTRGPPARALRFSDARALLDATRAPLRFDPDIGSTTFQYTSSDELHEVWYEDDRALSVKLSLILKYGLRGVGAWRLGHEDPAAWTVWDQVLAPVASRPQAQATAIPLSSPAPLPVGPLDLRPSTRGQLPTVWGGDGAEVDLLIANPSTGEAVVQIDLFRRDGSRVHIPRRLAPAEELTVPLSGDVGGEDVAVAFTSDVPVRVVASSRAVDGARSIVQASEPATRWIFPDGQSDIGVSTVFALFNHGPTAVGGRITGRGDTGAMVWDQPFRLAPGERRLVQAPPAGGHLTFWTNVVADGPVSAARQTRFLAAAQANGGNTTPAQRWSVPRAILGPPWVTYLVVVNPGDRNAEVRVRWLTHGSAAAEQRMTVPPMGRISIEGSTQTPDLVARAEVTSTVPVVVERTGYDTTGVATTSDIGLPQPGS